MSKAFISGLAIILTVSIVAPYAFLIAPQKVQAGAPVFVDGTIELPFSTKTALESTITAINETIQGIATPIQTAAQVALQINAYVLQPLAFVMSGKLMKLLTASVIGFVIGKANGTGVPQFVVDVMKTMQTVSDSHALAYLKQIGSTNSPFASSITSALNTDYLTKTSLAGFWAANMCTLKATSPDVPGYLAGNWSQGGVAAWFALTTQTKNNPYLLYGEVREKLGTNIGSGISGVTGVRTAQLNWGQGFMSWCGATDTSSGSTPTCPDGSNYITANKRCEYGDGSPAVAVSASGAQGVNPGDPCMKDGVPGTIQTPGSTIKATLDKVLGGQQDQIVRMGNIGGQITSILGDIATVMNTVNFASQLLGGSDSNSGLLNVGNTTSSGSSRLSQFQDTTNYLGVSNSQIYKDSATISSSGFDMLNRISQYQSAWNTIGASASTASTSVASLISLCATSSTISPDIANAQITAGRDALATEIAPVFAQASTATAIANSARAMFDRVQNDLISGVESATSTYVADLQSLQTMAPTGKDIATAQQNAQAFGLAVASPPGSLNVASTSSSIVDQMNLISANARALMRVCTPTDTSSLGGG